MKSDHDLRDHKCLEAAIEDQSSGSRMEGKEKAVLDWRGCGSDTKNDTIGGRYGFQLACVRVR